MTFHQSPFDADPGPEPVWLTALRDIAFGAALGTVFILLPICIHAYFTRPQGALPHALPHQGVTTSVPDNSLTTRAEAGVSNRESAQ